MLVSRPYTNSETHFGPQYDMRSLNVPGGLIAPLLMSSPYSPIEAVGVPAGSYGSYAG